MEAALTTALDSIEAANSDGMELMEQQTRDIEEMARQLASTESKVANLNTALQEARAKVDEANAAVGSAQVSLRASCVQSHLLLCPCSMATSAENGPS